MHINQKRQRPRHGRGRRQEFTDCRDLAVLIALSRLLLTLLTGARTRLSAAAAALLLPATLAGLLLLLTRTRLFCWFGFGWLGWPY